MIVFSAGLSVSFWDVRCETGRVGSRVHEAFQRQDRGQDPQYGGVCQLIQGKTENEASEARHTDA